MTGKSNKILDLFVGSYHSMRISFSIQ